MVIDARSFPEVTAAQGRTADIMVFESWKTKMPSPHLRVFPRPDDPSPAPRSEPKIPLRLAELFPLLAEAYRGDYLWLEDFADDTVMITRDLYEIVHAFSQCRPSA